MSENFWITIWVPWTDGKEIYWLVKDDYRIYPRIPYQGDYINAIDDDQDPIQVQISHVYMANNGLIELMANDTQPLEGEPILRFLEEAGYISAIKSEDAHHDDLAIFKALFERKPSAGI